MAKVENDVVKMDWEKSEWLGTKKGIFILAGKTYEGSKGAISVLFNPNSAYLFVEDEGLDSEYVWSTSEVKDWYKENKPTDFPYEYDEMIAVIDYGETECNTEVLEKYGIEEFKADIEARLKDVKPYGIDTEVTF